MYSKHCGMYFHNETTNLEFSRRKLFEKVNHNYAKQCIYIYIKYLRPVLRTCNEVLIKFQPHLGLLLLFTQ